MGRPLYQRHGLWRGLSFLGGGKEVPGARIVWNYVKFVRESGESSGE